MGPPIWPSQACLMGVPAGTLFGNEYPYSSALKQSGIVWDDDTLDAFLKDPQSLIPGTVMGNEPMNDPMERQMMIGILKSYCTDMLGPEGDNNFVETGGTLVPSTEVPDRGKETGAAAGSAGGLIWSSSMWMVAPVVVTSWLLGIVGGNGRRS